MHSAQTMKARTWEVPQWVVCPWVHRRNANPSYKCSLLTCLTHKSDVGVAVCQEDAVDARKTWTEMRPCGHLRVKRPSRFHSDTHLRYFLTWNNWAPSLSSRWHPQRSYLSLGQLPPTVSIAITCITLPLLLVPHEEYDVGVLSAVEKLSPRVSSLQSSELCQSSININNAHCLRSRFGFGMKIKLMVLINLIHMHALILNILFHDNLQFCRENNVSEIGHWRRLHDFDELFTQQRNGIHL